MEPSALKDELHLSHTRLTNAVNLLEQAEVLEVDADGRLHYAERDPNIGDAVSAATEVAESHVRMDRSRVEMMRGYAETTGCRRQFLLGYFGESLPQPCGRCDTCESGSATAAQAEARERRPAARRGRRGAAAATPFPLNAAVTHREWGPGIVMRVEDDRITVLFESVGYKTLALAALGNDDGLLAAV